MSIVVAILIFGLVVLIHELGHFLFARKAGILVEEFAIGMGPKLVGKTVGDTLYSIRVIPFGGYCKMLGEDDAVEEEGSYSSKSIWQRFQVIFAGPFFNFILAFVFAIVFIALAGTATTTISSVEEGTPAMEAGLLPGDKVVGYNGRSIIAQKELNIYMMNELPELASLEVKRDGEKMSFDIQPFYDEQGRYRVGIGFEVFSMSNPLQIIRYAAVEVIVWIKIVIYSLGTMLSGNVSRDDIAGPVGIVGAISQGYEESVKYGFRQVMKTISFFVIILSSNLGVMNLLPIPALDGGRLMFIFVEALRGKPVDPDKEGFIHFVGFVVLMGLMVLILINDIF